MSAASQRLGEERKRWRKDHPHGFIAKPETKPDGSINMLHWKCSIPGKDGTLWEGGVYPVDLIFPTDYPNKAPIARFPPGFFHLNVYPSGAVCLSILSDDPDMGGTWQPSISVKEVLLGLQALLNDENPGSPANPVADETYRRSKPDYFRKVQEMAAKYAPAPDTAPDKCK